MFRLDLHIHTEHSFNCSTSIEAIVHQAETVGLDAIAICDHQTLSAVTLARAASERLMIIPASEIRTARGAHIIGLFLEDEINSRDINEVIDEIHSQKGLVLLPHPYRPVTGLLFLKDENRLTGVDDFGRLLSRIDLIELATPRCRPEEIIRTNDFLKTHQEIPQVVSSDAHSLDEIGRAYLELEIEKPKNLAELKSVLLAAPRLMRFEVFHDGSRWETETASRDKIYNRLIRNTGRTLAAPIRTTVGNIYRKSSGLIQRSRQSSETRRRESSRRNSTKEPGSK